MKINTRVSEIYDRLNKLSTGKITFLEASNNFQLLIGVILSAQTTDRQVNGILPELFSKYPLPAALGAANPVEVKEIIRPLGFFNVKALNIIKTAAAIHDKYDDEVPYEMNRLLELTGVGRKSANVIRGECFGLPAIIVDTHFGRIVRRLGLTTEKNPDRVEEDLSSKVKPEIQYRFSMLLNKHGRTHCKARSPLCDKCPLSDLCEWKA